MESALRNLLVGLAGTRSLVEAAEIVRKLEAKHGFRWRPVGDREGNYGNINIGSDPGHALVERVTNAIDAVVEREALRALSKSRTKNLPSSPREAVETWFGIPGGKLYNLPVQPRKDLPRGTLTRQQLADNIIIRIFESHSKKQPTLEVTDRGIGITPEQIPNTFLSLNETNKINKSYLAGAYGQGGSTALAFSPLGTLIISRKQPDLLQSGERDSVAVTFVRYNELDPSVNKNGRYEYLVDSDYSVASIGVSASRHEPGTTVVHFHMDIPKYSARMTQLTGSLWWLLQNSLFDPVLAFWVEERRPSILSKGQELDRRTIAGNYTRLMDDRKERIELANSVQTRLSATRPDLIRINYWVVKPNPDNPIGQPIDVYVDPYKPIVFSFNGQTHGTEERRFTAERLSLPYLAKFLIIHVELDRLSAQSRRALLSTTRDRLKQLALYDDMREAIAAALSEDEDLVRLNDERKERLLSRQSEAERNKMRERFARLMERFRAGVDVTAGGKGTDIRGRKRVGVRTREPLAPLPTQDEPTFIRIANVQKPIPIRIDRHALIRIESDAPDGYLSDHIHSSLTPASDPEEALTMVSRSDFRGGRSRLTVSPGTGARPGNSGVLNLFLLTATGKVLSTKANFKIEKPEDQPTAGGSGKAKVHVPDPIPIYHDKWPDFSWNEGSVSEVRDDGKDINIFVNLENRHLAKLLMSQSYQEAGVARMKNNYLLYVAFYSWVKHTTEIGKEVGLEGKEFEEYKQRELDRVAQVVSLSISSASRLDDED